LVILLIASRLQQGITESQHFFERLTPELEQLQRMRASYNWISTWSKGLVAQYVFLFAICLVACRRLWPRMPDSLKPLAIGLPVIGVISMPVSLMLLDHWHWAFIPQLQPMRALLFVTALAVILGVVAGVHSAREKRWLEAVAWFLLPWLVPMRIDL